MQDTTKLIYQALVADTTLLTLLGGKVAAKGWNRIYNGQISEHAEEYPRMTMFEVVNEDANSADDEPQDSEAIVRVDLWSKDEKPMFSICKQAKKVIKTAISACNVSIQTIGYEIDTKVYHKQLEINLLLKQEVL